MFSIEKQTTSWYNIYVCTIYKSQFQVLCKPSLWCRIEIH